MEENITCKMKLRDKQNKKYSTNSQYQLKKKKKNT